jgi:Cof subfamily protein (haloacid dehalogenase superfamily)
MGYPGRGPAKARSSGQAVQWPPGPRPGAYHRPIASAPDASPPIRLLLADVDGTLVTQDKVLTDDAVAAVGRLRHAGVLFALTSGRPPRGMEMLLEPLDIDTPVAAFNGGLMVDRSLNILQQHALPEKIVQPVIDLMKSFDLDTWLYRGADWYVTDPKAPHVDREAWTVKFAPTVAASFEGLTKGAIKLVGDDHGAIAEAAEAAAAKFGDHVTAAASQPYYLDVTHPRANKGEVALYLARHYKLEPEEIATIGDQPNDILMFDHSGLSVAMANADPAAKQAANETTKSNEDEGFAFAVEHFVLPAAGSQTPPSTPP